MASPSDRAAGKRPMDAPGASGSGDSPDDGGNCPECGRHFPSRKALFGHMRCHPDRNWRGIHPPPPRTELELRPPSTTALVIIDPPSDAEPESEETHAAADSLILLSESEPVPISSLPPAIGSSDPPPPSSIEGSAAGSSSGPFECSGCMRVFESFQALGGHRASHRNVKGCFAAGRASAEAPLPPISIALPKLPLLVDLEGIRRELGIRRPPEQFYRAGGGNDYKCSVCHKSFPTGQALGGHMRWHLEREPLPLPGAAGSSSSSSVMSSSVPFTRWVPVTSSGGVSIGGSVGMEELWGSSIRWLQERVRRQGITLGMQKQQQPQLLAPPPSAFHPGWGPPRGVPAPPPPPPRGYGMRAPWHAGGSSSNAPLGFGGRPLWFAGGSSSSSSALPDAVQVHRIPAVTTSSTIVTTVAAGHGHGQGPPPLREQQRGRPDDDGNGSGSSGDDSDIDLDLKLGR